MSTVYRIAKFDDVFTKRDGRKDSGELRWVSMPIGFSSGGYQALIEDFGDEAPTIYGAWCALVSIAAGCPTPGVLCSSRGRAITPQRAAALAYMPVDPFRKLFKWASAQDIGWLEVAQTSGESPDDCPDDRPETVRTNARTTVQDKTLQDRTEQNISCPASPNVSEPEPPKRPSSPKGEHPGFRDWYAAYPKKAKPKAAAVAYAKAVKDIQGRDGLGGKDPVGFLLNRAKAFAASGIGKGDAQYIPHPASWLNAGSYDDDESCWARSSPRELTAARGSPIDDPRNAMGVNAQVKQLIRSGATAAYADPPSSRGEP